MFDAGTVLIAIALATAITGTYWDAKRWSKHAIVALAIVSASAAIWDSQNKAKEVESTRRNINWVVRAVQPPGIFDAAVLSGFRTIAEEYGLFVSGQTIDVEDGSRISNSRSRPTGKYLESSIWVSLIGRNYSSHLSPQKKTVIRGW